ncbi:hemerythrin domain-containing protein [Nitrospira sp. MA-1]|nr:hemerythrin domain-containing protein [Nitrospira sp. MA-1]
MDIYQALKEDHQEAKQLFSQIEAAGKNSDSRGKLFLKLKDALEAHSEAEEQVFYTPLQKNEETKQKINHANKEHEKVTTLLNEIEAMDPQDENWGKRVSKLKEDVQHHIQEEEGEIFKNARGILSQDQADQMGEEFKQVKEKKV